MKIVSTDALTELIQLSKNNFLDKNNTTAVSTIALAAVATSGSYADLSNKPTISDLTTTEQLAAINSGATTTNIGQIATNTSAISTINGKIPSQATSSNKLADKAFVNSTVQTNTANFRGNWDTWSLVPTSANDYPADYAGSRTPTVNDYMVVQDASGYGYSGPFYAWHGSETTIYTTSATPQVGDAIYDIIGHGFPDDPDYWYEVILLEDAAVVSVSGLPSSITIGEQGSTSYTFNRSSEEDVIVPSDYEGTWRFKYSGTWSTDGKSGWLPEYQINETPMTAAQLAAINSGITSSLVTQIGTNQSDISNIQNTMVTASNTITFTNKTIDAEGTGNSISNLKTSNFKSGVIVTTVGSTGSDTSIPTEQAVREALTTLNNGVVHKITATNPALTATGGICTWSVTNSLATADVGVHVYEVSTGSEVMTDVTPGASTITIKINSSSNISAGVYKAVVMG